MNHRGRARPPRASRPPTTYIATAPRQVWCWDVTFLPTLVQGRWFYMYMILDIYSRKIVGFEVHDTDSAHHAAQLAKRAALAEGLHGMDVKPVLHGDNGATVKATTVTAMLDWLGIKPSHSARASATTTPSPKPSSAPRSIGQSSRQRVLRPRRRPRLGCALRALVQQ